MNRMVVYSVSGFGDGLYYYATKAQAVAEAKKEAAHYHADYGDVAVYAHYIVEGVKRRPLHVLLLNHRGWCAEQELVDKFPCTGKADEDA